MTDTTKNNVPDGFILLQTQNGAPKYAACMTGRLAGWLMKKYPDGNWVSERKLTNLEVMQAEDQRDDGIVHETSAATIQQPVMVAEPVGSAVPIGYANLETVDFAICFFENKIPPGYLPVYLAAQMVADPAGVAFDREEFICQVALSIAEMDRDSPEDQPEMMLVTPAELQNTMRSVFERFDEATTVKAVPSEALDRAAILEEAARCVEDFQAGNGTVSFNDIALSIRSLAAPLADKTGGGAA